MKNFLYMVSAGLIIGVSVMAIFLLNKQKKDGNGCSDCNGTDEKQPLGGVDHCEKVMPAEQDAAYRNARNSAIETIYSRHEGAAALIKDSVAAIRENLNTSASINDEIDELSAELDKMTSEE